MERVLVGQHLFYRHEVVLDVLSTLFVGELSEFCYQVAVVLIDLPEEREGDGLGGCFLENYLTTII